MIEQSQMLQLSVDFKQIEDFFQIIKLTYLFQMKNEGINQFKFKAIIFYILSLAILSDVLGVLFFRDALYIFTILSLGYALLKYTQMAFIMVYVNYRFSESMESFRKRQIEKYESAKEITHVFIIPNYCQQIEMLKQTVMTLAKHSRAHNYCIFLAMEKHQMNAEEKALKIIKQCSKNFRLLSYTLHETQEGESKSKSSNINWCARHFTPQLLENYVNMDSVMVTIMDSDSHIPEPYVDQVERHLEQNYDKRHIHIYQPPQIFTRNERQTSFFVRIIDNLMSTMHCSQLYSIMDYTLGVSNYSLSYRLLERIGFWDTCIYSKGQDCRIVSKALWKTNGQTKTCPIYIPINQMNLATHEGYYADFKARMEQAKRHAQDQVELSYNFMNMIHSPISFMKKFHVFFTACEVYLMPLVIPVYGLTLLCQDVIPILPRSSLDPNGDAFVIFNNINTIILFIVLGLFQLLKKRASKTLYQIETLNCFYAIQMPLLQIPIVILFGFIPMITASFSMLTDNIIFKVTLKKSLSNKSSATLAAPASESIFTSQEIQQNSLINSKSTSIDRPLENISS